MNPSLPTLFVGHGSPMQAVETSTTTRFFAEWPDTIPLPQAVLVISAHWLDTPLSITHWDTCPILHDFYGFPEALYRLDYPAPGSPKMAERVVSLLEAESGGMDGFGPVNLERERGLDHGAWVPLRHMFPQANVPVVQVSMPAGWHPEKLYRLGLALAPLRQEGVVILASGSATHNLKCISSAEAPPPQWAVVFDEWLREKTTRWELHELFEFWVNAPHGTQAHPTSEHLTPLFVAMGAAHEGRNARVVHDGFSFGCLSNLCLEFGRHP